MPWRCASVGRWHDRRPAAPARHPGERGSALSAGTDPGAPRDAYPAPMARGQEATHWSWRWASALWDDVVAGHDTDVSGGLLVLGWFGALATALVIRPAYRRALTDAHEIALRRARD